MEDLTMTTRDGEQVLVTQAGFTREGIAEMAVQEAETEDGRRDAVTIITAVQARELASYFDKLATHWGE